MRAREISGKRKNAATAGGRKSKKKCTELAGAATYGRRLESDECLGIGTLILEKGEESERGEGADYCRKVEGFNFY